MARFRTTGEIPKVEHKSPPHYHMFVDTESNWSQTDGQTRIINHTLRFGYAQFCKFSDNQMMLLSDCTFYTVKEFWDWFAMCRVDTRMWVWAHNLAFDGTLLQLWNRLQKDDCELTHFTDSDLPAFFQCNIGGQSYQFLDSLNIFRTSLAKIGDELGLEKMEMPQQTEGIEKWLPYCQRDVEVLRGIIERWAQFIQLHKLGKMAPSLAGQSLVSYRCRFMKHPIHIHCNEGVTALERDAYIGGLTDPKFIGYIPDSPIYELDINSLYPYVMSKNKFPNSYMGSERWPQEKRWKKMLRDYYCIAHVQLETTTKVFPVRTGDKLIYPYGRYWTSLHQPELERAFALGLIRNVGFIAYYSSANLFHDFVTFFYKLRQEYKKQKNGTFEYMCKILMNSLYGKFGQRQPHWEKYTEEKVERLELKGGLMPGQLDVIREHIAHYEMHDLKFRHPYNDVLYGARRLLGVEQLLMGEGESPFSFPAISGAVTSYAREHVRNIQEMIGKHNLFYTDTDSFFVNAKGKKRLEELGMLSDTVLGKMKQNTVNEYMLIFGPKDYMTNNERKRKGVRGKAKATGWAEYDQEQWPGFKGLRNKSFPHSIQVKIINKKLKRQHTRYTVSKNGWTIPLLVSLDNYKKY